MNRLPKDCSSRAIADRAVVLLYCALNPIHWTHHEITGRDNGIDLTIEHINDDNEFDNGIIDVQVKGTRNPNLTTIGDFVNFDFDVKTANYALNDKRPFLLVVVDVENETVYYQCVQDFFIEHPEKISDLINNEKTIRIRIPIRNIISYEDDNELRHLSKIGFIYRESTLKRM